MPAKKKVEKIEETKVEAVEPATEEEMVPVQGDDLPPVVPVNEQPKLSISDIFKMGKHPQAKKSRICDPTSSIYNAKVAKRRTKEKARRRANRIMRKRGK